MVEILYFFLHKTLNINSVFIILVMLPLGFFLATPGRIQLPYNIQAVPLALLFYTIGCRFSSQIKQRCYDNLKKKDIFLYLLLFILPIYATITHSVINMSEIDRIFPDYLIIPIGCFGCIGVGKILENSNILSWFGKNSLVIMALHILYMLIAYEYIRPYVDGKILYKIIEMTIVFSLSVLSVLFINKKASWIIRK